MATGICRESAKAYNKMIVMKFGGSSLSSAASISRVVSIIQSQRERPVVIASAMGDTTDDLLQILSHARRAETYSALKLQDQLKNRHFAVCEELLREEVQRVTEHLLNRTFRDLHVRMLEVAEGERAATADLQDWTTSLGEQLSSRVLAAVLKQHCGNAVHLDSRKVILTNDRFSNAEPLYWETYARIRWAVPAAARQGIPVLGGFIGSTADGRTTTLGRGGSDLTASIVGAAVNAEEIQVWKDVDGMLTCDPRVLEGAHQVKALSYEEAAELARAGATILHPETMTPARRLRIPIVIRNTFSPEHAGTRIESRSPSPTGKVKSIAIQKGVTLLEVRSAEGQENRADLSELCNRVGSPASILCSSDEAVFIAMDGNSIVSEENIANASCTEVRLRSRQAILTLVGEGINHQAVSKHIAAALPETHFFVIPDGKLGNSVRLSVPEDQLKRTARALHDAFFAHPDPRSFISAESATKAKTRGASVEKTSRRPRSFNAQPALLRFN